MANNCNNYTTFSGEQKELKKLKGWWQTNMIDNYPNYRTLFDLPIQFEENTPKDVYQVFGTKWVETDDIELEDNLIVRCDTAWSPYNGLLSLVCNLFNVDVHNEYEESGNDIGGEYSIIQGEIIDNPSESYRDYVREFYENEQIYDYVSDNCSEWEIEELQEFEDKLTDTQYKMCKDILLENQEL